MPGVYVLVVILAGGLAGNSGGGAGLSTEFNTLDACQTAERAVLAAVPKYRLSGDFVTVVKCFPKGERPAAPQP
ncbi:MAG: hypothetical protein ACHQF3_02170 [Alphaproteobacteria bacterium]